MPKTPTKFDPNTIFQSLETPFIVFGVDDPAFTIIEENHAHARVAMVKRDEVVGKPLLEVFPDTSEEYLKTGNSQLLESLRTVLKTGKPDSMPNLKYDIRNRSGAYTPKYWSVTHYPLFADDRKQIQAIYQETRDITDEVVTEQRLARTQSQLDQMLDSNLAGTWYWDLSRDMVMADENLARLFGVSPTAAKKGLPLERFTLSIHEKDRPRVERAINHAVTSGKPFEEEYRTVSSDHDLRWVIARGTVQYDARKRPEIFSGIIFDVTDRKRAERELVSSEKRLRFMADSMPQLVYTARPDGYREGFNQRWFEFTGAKPGQLEGHGWLDFYHPDDRSRVEREWRRAIKTKKQYEVECRIYHADMDGYRWVIGRALPFFDESGAIIKWYGTCTDIDDQKHSADVQTFLSDISKELSTTLDYKKMLKKITRLAVPTVADWCTIDLYDGQKGFEQVSVAHTNPQHIEQVLAYRKHNPVNINDPTGLANVMRTGKSEYYPTISNDMIEHYIKDPDRLAFMKSLDLHSIIIAPICVSNKPIGGLSFVTSDSGRYYDEDDLAMVEELAARVSLAITNSKLYADSLSDLKNRQNLEQELLVEKQKLESRVKERTKQLQLTNEGLREEITKRRQVEAELEGRREDLERSNAELEDFAYVASHDLQEPLRKIQAFSNLLVSEYGEQLGEGSQYVDRMNAAALRMSTLIQDLLTFSRVTTKREQPQKVSLREIVSDVLQDLEARIEDVDGTVIVNRLPSILADPTHMRQLFQNLIGNALKFHQADLPPVVKVSADNSHKTFLEVRVSDNGIGFDQKYLDRIFAVFQRLHGRDTYDGTGIGLAVCRKIVDRYGGTITAESEKNKGATFIVRLPKMKEARR